jgi:hypothetical protein
MDKLNAVEVCEIGQIKVNAQLGATIFDAAKECLFLVNLLNVSVQLYFNGRYVNIYKSDTIDTIVQKTLYPVK